MTKNSDKSNNNKPRQGYKPRSHQIQVTKTNSGKDNRSMKDFITSTKISKNRNSIGKTKPLHTPPVPDEKRPTKKPQFDYKPRVLTNDQNGDEEETELKKCLYCDSEDVLERGQNVYCSICNALYPNPTTDEEDRTVDSMDKKVAAVDKAFIDPLIDDFPDTNQDYDMEQVEDGQPGLEDVDDHNRNTRKTTDKKKQQKQQTNNKNN